jgi:hypothetical protein
MFATSREGAMRGPGDELDGAAAVADPRTRAASERLADRAIEWLKDDAGRVRVEDYLTVLGALAGEAALVAARVLASVPPDHALPPGSAVFGDAINEILTGDTADLASVPPGSLVGIVAREIVPGLVSAGEFPRLDELYRNVAANVGKTPWGHVAVSVPDDNRPTVPPLFAAYALRGVVDSAQTEAALPNPLRHVPPALALAHGLRQVDGAIDMEIGVRLALEVVFGTAKLAPLSQADVDAAKTETGQPGS